MESDASLDREQHVPAAPPHSAERLGRVLDTMANGVVEVTSDHADDLYSARMFTMLGYEPVPPDQGYAFLRARLHPDDAPAYEANRRRVYQEGLDEYAIEFRLQAADGSWRWILARGRCLERDASGAPLRLIGTHADVTERHWADEALRHSEARYRSLVANMAEGLVVLDADGVIRECNASAEEILGLSAEDLLGRTPLDPGWEAIHDDGSLFPGEAHPGPVTLRTGEPLRSVVMGLWGGKTWLSINTQPLFREGEGRPHAVVVSFREIGWHREIDMALRRYAQRLEASHAIYQAIMAGRPVEEVCRTALRLILELVPCEHAAVAILGPSGGGDIRTVLGEASDVFPAGTPAPFTTQDLLAFTSHDVRVIDDLEGWRDYHPGVATALAGGLRSFAAVPLFDGDELVGALNLAARTPGAFGPEAIEILREMGPPLAVAIQAARLREAERRQAAELARTTAFANALAQVAIHLQTSHEPPQVIATLGSELEALGIRCFVGLLDAARETLAMNYRPSALDRSLAPEWVEQLSRFRMAELRERLPELSEPLIAGRPVFVAAFRSAAAPMMAAMPQAVVDRLLDQAGLLPQTRAFLLPLTAEGQTLGLLGLWGDELRYDDLATLTPFAAQVAAALENARLVERIRDHERDLQRLSAEVIEAQESERQRLARELHDELGQALTAMRINLLALDRALAPHLTAALTERLDDTRSLVESTLQRARDLAVTLRPAMLDDLGLAPTLRWTVHRAAERLGVAGTFEEYGLEGRLPSAIETALYRIVQEGLTNIARYAQAAHLTVSLRCDPAAVTLRIEDDGRGFDVQRRGGRQDWERGTGLLGIQERVAALGGRLEVRSSVGRGTCLSVEIPLCEGEPLDEPSAP